MEQQITANSFVMRCRTVMWVCVVVLILVAMFYIIYCYMTMVPKSVLV